MRKAINYLFSYRIWLPFCSICVFLLTAELILRVIDVPQNMDTGFRFYIRQVDNEIARHVENKRGCNFMREHALLMWHPRPYYKDGLLEMNSMGLHDREYSLHKPPHTLRILCLGDSCTFGYGVLLKDTYHALLEEQLNSDPEISPKVEVINAGVTGYTSSQGVSYYRYYGRKLEPDYVTFYFGINDPIKRFHLSDNEIMQNGIPGFCKVIVNEYLLNCHLYVLMQKFIRKIPASSDVSSAQKVPRVSEETYKDNIYKLNALCEKEGARLLLISPPLCKYALGKERRADQIHKYRQVLYDAAEKEGIPVIHCKAMTELAADHNWMYFQDAVHPNKNGHRFIMKELLQFFEKNIGNSS